METITDLNKPELLIEVAYALPDRQKILAVHVPAGTSALEAVKRSGIVQLFPEIDVDNAEMGIFSKHMNGKMLPPPDQYILQDRDRVEIYRPLIIDPKEARKNRAAKVKAKAQDKDKDKKVMDAKAGSGSEA